MDLGTKEINRKTVHSLPANYVSLAQLKEKWLQKKKQEQEHEQREKEEQEELIRKQEVEERNRKLEEEQRKKRLGKDVQESENRYSRAKKNNSRKIPSPHHWNRRNVSGTTYRVVPPPCPEPVLEQVPAVKMHLKFASGLIEDDELKPGQTNQRKGKEICTEPRWNGNPILEDHRKGNIKQSPAKSKVHKTFASIVPETFEDGRESSVKLEIGGNSNARKVSISEPVLEQVAMAMKEVFNISPGLVENGEPTFCQPNQRKERERYTENRRNGNPILEDRCKGDQKQSHQECKGDKTTASVAPETFKNGSESVQHEICLNSNADMEVKDVFKISTLKIGHPKQWKEKIYTEKKKNGNPKSEDGLKRNQKQSQAEGQGAKTIASFASGTFKNEKEGVEREIGRHSNVTTVDNPPPETIAHRFENLSMKGNASRFRPKHENPKLSKLVWVRKEDVSSNNDLNGAQSSGSMKFGTKDIDRRLYLLPTNYVTLDQLKEKWLEKKRWEQEQEELILKQEIEEQNQKQELEERNRKQEVEERNRKQEEEQRKKRLGKDVQDLENWYNQSKEARRRNIPLTHQWNRGSGYGTTKHRRNGNPILEYCRKGNIKQSPAEDKVDKTIASIALETFENGRESVKRNTKNAAISEPTMKVDFKFASSLAEDDEPKLVQPNHVKGIYTENRRNGNPISKDRCKGNKKQSLAESQVVKAIASIAPETFEKGRESVKCEIGGNSNARNANISELMLVKEVFKISPGPVKNDEPTFCQLNQRKGKEIYIENRSGSLRLKDRHKRNKKQSQQESDGDNLTVFVVPKKFENGMEGIKHEIGQNSNNRSAAIFESAPMEPDFKFTSGLVEDNEPKLTQPNQRKGKELYAENRRDGNSIFEYRCKGNKKQFPAEVDKTIASITSKTFENERESVKCEIGGNSNARNANISEMVLKQVAIVKEVFKISPGSVVNDQPTFLQPSQRIGKEIYTENRRNENLKLEARRKGNKKQSQGISKGDKSTVSVAPETFENGGEVVQNSNTRNAAISDLMLMEMKVDLKLASDLVQPIQKKGKEICTENRRNGNPISEDCRKGNKKKFLAEGKVDKMIASIAPEKFENGREIVNHEIVGNSNSKNVYIWKPVLERVTMEFKEFFKISPVPVENDETTFHQPNQRKGKEIYRENKRNVNPKLEGFCKRNKKQSQGESKGETFENGSVEHEIYRNSNGRNIDMEVEEVLKISTSKIAQPKLSKRKKKQKNGNPKSEDSHKGNLKQSHAKGQGGKTIASVASETLENEREGVEREIDQNSNVHIVDDPPSEVISQRFENLSMKGNGSGVFNRCKRENPKRSKLVWVRKEDISSNVDPKGKKKQKNGNPKSENSHKGNQQQSHAKGQVGKTIASVASETLENEREGVEREIDRNSNVHIVDDPPSEVISQRFENLPMKGNGSGGFNRCKRENSKRSKLVWVRKGDISSNVDLNGPQSSGSQKYLEKE